MCADGSCIKGKLKCDGDPDCDDNSDEDPSLCKKPALEILDTGKKLNVKNQVSRRNSIL
jgi:hypothetical protein